MLDNALGRETPTEKTGKSPSTFPSVTFAQNLFLFPIAFGVNKIKNFNWIKDGAALQLIMVFCSMPFAKAARGVPFLSKKGCKRNYRKSLPVLAKCVINWQGPFQRDGDKGCKFRQV